MAKQSVTVYINEQYQFFVGETPSSQSMLQSSIAQQVAGQNDASIVLRADKTVPVQYIVNVIDAVNAINNQYNTKHKVILATSPKEE